MNIEEFAKLKKGSKVEATGTGEQGRIMEKDPEYCAYPYCYVHWKNGEYSWVGIDDIERIK